MEIPSSNGDLQQQMILGDSSSEDLELKAPKKRAETWVQDETRCLINFRREVDALFNTSKSNKHLWEQIAHKMRDKGFDRSPTMCTDKWRNLLKEFKKVKQQDKGHNNNIACGSSAIKLWYYKDLEELLRHRTKNDSYKIPHRHPPTPKIDGFVQFSDKGTLPTHSFSFTSILSMAADAFQFYALLMFFDCYNL